MTYLTKEDILLIHSIAIDETGGMHGVRDHHAILVLEDLPKQRVFGKELYPTIFEKAAVYTRNVITSHPFVDGNKRTAVTASSVFLENNGYKVEAKEGKIEEFALKVISDKLEIKEISAWFKKHSRKITRNPKKKR